MGLIFRGPHPFNWHSMKKPVLYSSEGNIPKLMEESLFSMEFLEDTLPEFLVTVEKRPKLL